MGKRSDFQRRKGDFYETPPEPVAPLIPYLVGRRYVEPCAGAGKLIGHLASYGLDCIRAFDIDPKRRGVRKKDALRLTARDVAGADLIITNPPWTRSILHALIPHLVQFGLPVWLLFDADWKHTIAAGRFEGMLRMVISVGRVKWIAGSRYSGKDNAAWYGFGLPSNDLPRFRMRSAI